MDNINSLKDDIYKNENNNENDIEMKYTLITPNNSESFKAELQNNIEQYKYEFEKRLYNVLNKDIFSASFDPQKNIFDINGNFITYPEKKNNQKWKRKSKNNINFIKKNSFIYSSSILNLDLGNQDSNSSSLSKPKFKSENNISELLKKNMNNQNISKRKAFSYNNVSNLQNSSFNRTVENNSNNNDKKNLKYKSKDYQIRKTYEDLQRELENLENEFNNKSEESNEDKIKIDMRKKELHKNYKEYIKLNNNNNNTDNPNLRRYKNYVNDFEWVKQRHLDAINKQSIPKTTTEINEITERLYNPNNYPNVYKMKFNTGKSNEKLDSNTNVIIDYY
ncbi:hypothetical protein BCR36DRAFT_395877 [Piromyces finnis]|uniref:Uncharacterized protein n=1 Tax=Piromyces finnis TaxID=1754191 RepID=A0A1Y1VGR3_9FUNG|nr:hypothetical protein BCR36DRAFT_395877 [Piromyces finnis]|eukprot:ORX55273.1 hypothetical protein BCR36DRAFT_395877 [Piromyces finnis]